MNKKLVKFLSLTVALVLCLAMMPTAMAGTPASTGKSASITPAKNLIMKSDAAVPKAQFEFTLSSVANDAQSSNEYIFPLRAGIMQGVAVSGTNVTSTVGTDGKFVVKFTGTEQPTNGLPSDGTSETTSGYKYATESFTIDFSGVDFPEPGVYRYKLEETDPTDPSPFDKYDTETGIRYIDVYVEYELLSAPDTYKTTPSIMGVIMRTDNVEIAIDETGKGTSGTALTTKSEMVNNEYNTYDLKIYKNVTGNQGSRNQHFDFEVTVTNPTTADPIYPTTYTVTSDCTHNGATSTTITAGTSSTFKLKTGEHITIEGLPAGATYTIVETSLDYVASATVGGAAYTDADSSDTTFTVNSPVDGIAADTTVIYTNSKSGTIPTGVLLTIAPFAALMVIGLLGVVLVLKKRKN